MKVFIVWWVVQPDYERISDKYTHVGWKRDLTVDPEHRQGYLEVGVLQETKIPSLPRVPQSSHPLGSRATPMEGPFFAGTQSGTPEILHHPRHAVL